MPKTLSAIIIDDEKRSIETLSTLVSNFIEGVEVLDSAQTVEEGIRLILKHQPQLLFLDIELNTGMGFDVLKAFAQPEFEVIFVTAFSEYALDAFEFSAVGYLLKPVRIDRLNAAIEKARYALEWKGSSQRIQSLMNRLTGPSTIEPQITVPTLDGFQVLKLAEIFRLESDSNYTRIYSEGEKPIVVSRTLKEFEQLLAEKGFFRIHRRHIVNFNQVKRYIKGNGGEVIMNDGSTLQVARTRKEEFLKLFNAG